ncbi:hypothetical protein K7432_015476 [Basidiobolus ranarum]|uniref:Uncharacterized protein n=1 Tax=Basidiobolus ranarum TaxID=34480 RepID=A0ABR2VMZ7_9FUNG
MKLIPLTFFNLSIQCIVVFGIDIKDIQNLVIFGDSYSDTGNLLNVTFQTYFPQGYVNGHFSNGLLWPEYTKNRTEWDIENYSFAGATVSNLDEISEVAFLGVPVPSIEQQIEAHKQRLLYNPNQFDSKDTLYVVAAAGNDYNWDRTPDPLRILELLEKATMPLFQPPINAKQVIFWNVGLEKLPRDRLTPWKYKLSLFQRKLHNKGLNEMVERYQSSNVDLKLKVFDQDMVLTNAVNDPSFTNRFEPCIRKSANGYISICHYPEKSVFWDDIHLTTPIHRKLTDEFLKTVKSL